jgi:5-methylcytosine-specific restriction protein A
VPILHRCHGVGGEGCGVLSEGVRCPAHARLRERGRTRDKRARRPYTAAERDRRAAAVRHWLATVGPRCPGTRGRGWHEVAPQDLTAEHGHAVAAGGDETQSLTVLCRACNSSKQDRYIE